MWLRKAHAGSASGGYEWKRDGDVIEVPDEIARELLERIDDEFSEAKAPSDAKTPPQEARSERTAREVTEKKDR